MDRYLVIADDLAPLSPTNRALEFANHKFNQRRQVKLVALHGSVPDLAEFRDLPFAVDSFQLPDRFDLAALRQLRNEVKRFLPDRIALFSGQPQRWLPALSFLRNQIEISLHVTSRISRLATSTRLFFRLTRGKIVWRVPNQVIQRDLIRCGICADMIQVESPPVLFDSKHRMNSTVSRRPESRSGYVVSTVAPLVPDTRIKDLIWACDLLGCIRDDVYLDIVGNGKQLHDLQNFVKHTAISDRIRFHGWTDQAEEIVASSDVYCEPSDWVPDSAALNIALQNGVPTCVVDSGHNRTRFKHGESALLFRRGARNEIGRQLRQLLDNHELSGAISETAFKQGGWRKSA